MNPPSVEQWAEAYVRALDPASKCALPTPGLDFEGPGRAVPVPRAPGRGPGFRVVDRARIRPGGLRSARARAEVLHTFCHHEVQAAELYARALLAFRSAPVEFRRGLLKIACDEIRHAALYRDRLRANDSDYGELPVRDWFWERVPSCETPVAFVSLMGLGLEGANLEHAETFAQRFREAGDEESARLCEQVGREEESHVRFGAHWFARWTDGSFDAWCRELPEPLTPWILRGKELNRPARRRAGQSEEFLTGLEAWAGPGS